MIRCVQEAVTNPPAGPWMRIVHGGNEVALRFLAFSSASMIGPVPFRALTTRYVNL